MNILNFEDLTIMSSLLTTFNPICLVREYEYLTIFKIFDS